MKDERYSCRSVLFGSTVGCPVLSLAVTLRTERWITRFLRSPLSRPFLLAYAKLYDIPISRRELLQYRSFRDFFARESVSAEIDNTPGHLISPVDGFLRAYPIIGTDSFPIKGSRYRLSDLLTDEALLKNYQGGICLIFRVSPADCHRFSYVDDGYQGCIHTISGRCSLGHSGTQGKESLLPLHRRSWCLMATEHFGPVIQTEIGALTLGSIVNNHENARVLRGSEKGHFELAGSTVVLLVEKERISLQPQLKAELERGTEVYVKRGMWIASREDGLR